MAQVIEENHDQLQRTCKHLVSSIQNHHSRRTRYLDELARLSKQLDSTGSGQTRGDLEARLSVLRSTISKLEDSITKCEDRLEMCRIREQEAQDEGQGDLILKPPVTWW